MKIKKSKIKKKKLLSAKFGEPMVSRLSLITLTYIKTTLCVSISVFGDVKFTSVQFLKTKNWVIVFTFFLHNMILFRWQTRIYSFLLSKNLNRPPSHGTRFVCVYVHVCVCSKYFVMISIFKKNLYFFFRSLVFEKLFEVLTNFKPILFSIILKFRINFLTQLLL